MQVVILNVSSNINKSEKRKEIIINAINDSLNFWEIAFEDIIFIIPNKYGKYNIETKLIEIMIDNDGGFLIDIEPDWNKYPKTALFELSNQVLKKAIALNKKYNCLLNIINIFCEHDSISSKSSLKIMDNAIILNFRECNYYYPVYSDINNNNKLNIENAIESLAFKFDGYIINNNKITTENFNNYIIKHQLESTE